MTDDFREFDEEKLQKKIDQIIDDYNRRDKFLSWILFLLSQEKDLKEALKQDEYKTRDYFASQGVEMLPGEVKYLMDAVEGVFTAFDFFKEYKDKGIDHDYDN